MPKVLRWDGVKFTEINIESGGDGHSLNSANGLIIDVVYVNNLGNVGMGLSPVSDAAERLQVNGNIRFPSTTADGSAGILKMGTARVLHAHGTNNFFLGKFSGNLTMTGAENVGLGTNTLLANTTGNNNLGIGSGSLSSNTTGYSNVGIGTGSLWVNTTGNNNTGIGLSSLRENNGSSNTGIGSLSLRYNTTGHSNVGVGVNALRENTTGTYNVGIGNSAVQNNQTGHFNIGIGNETLLKTTSSYNVGVGVGALRNTLAAVSNVGVGFRSLYSNEAGSNNTVVGDSSGYNTLGTGNVFLGFQAGYNELGDYKLYIANNSTSKPLIGGNFSLGRVGIGKEIGDITAKLHLPAGEISVNCAPLKLTSGSLLTAPETGAIEYDGTDFYATPIATRKAIAYKEDNVANILATVVGIDGKVIGTTNLYTVPAGKFCIVTGAIVRPTLVNSVTVPPRVGIGIATGEDDIIQPTELFGLNLSTEFFRFSVEGTARAAAGGDIIKLGIDTGATAITMTLSVYLIGFLI